MDVQRLIQSIDNEWVDRKKWASMMDGFWFFDSGCEGEQVRKMWRMCTSEIVWKS
jgi:hypothetical protein